MADQDRGDDLVLDTAIDQTKDTSTDDSATGSEAAGADEKALGATEDKGSEDKTSDEDAAAGKEGKFAKKSADEKMIPKARVDEMVRKEAARAEAAEARIRELQKQQKTVDRTADVEKLEGEITDLEKQHSKAIIDGDTDKAAALARDIRLKERQIQVSTSETMTTQAKEAATEDIRLDMTIEKLELEYPQLKAGADEFDEDVVDMVLSMQQSLILQNSMSPYKALELAADKIMAKLGIKRFSEAGVADPDKEPTKALDRAKANADRTQTQLDKNIDTANKQPPSTKDTGLDADKKGISANVDVSRLSQAEFDALPEATKERMRGDTL